MRPMVVAGQFYPHSKERLLAELDSLIPKEEKTQFYRGAVMPHAGYIYSGKTAGLVAGRLEVPETVVVLATNHSGLGATFSLLTDMHYVTPLGELPLALDLTKSLLTGGIFKSDSSAHSREHSLEVVLPFLQARRQKFNLLPVVVGNLSEKSLAEGASQLSKGIMKLEKGGEKKTLIVASTDMSHYVPEKVAQELDHLAINKMEKLDAPGLIPA